MPTRHANDIKVSETINAIRLKHGWDGERCPTCTRSVHSPYREFNEHGHVLYGCIDACHTGLLITPSESARWHNRAEAQAWRRRELESLTRWLRWRTRPFSLTLEARLAGSGILRRQVAGSRKLEPDARRSHQEPARRDEARPRPEITVQRPGDIMNLFAVVGAAAVIAVKAVQVHAIVRNGATREFKKLAHVK